MGRLDLERKTVLGCRLRIAIAILCGFRIAIPAKQGPGPPEIEILLKNTLLAFICGCLLSQTIFLQRKNHATYPPDLIGLFHFVWSPDTSLLCLSKIRENHVKIDDNRWKIDDNRWKIDENSMKIDEKTMKIDENQWK